MIGVGGIIVNLGGRRLRLKDLGVRGAIRTEVPLGDSLLGPFALRLPRSGHIRC